MAIKGIIGSAATRLRLAEHWRGNRMAKVAKIQRQFFSLLGLVGLMVGTCEESEPVVSLWCDSWEGTVTKLAGGLLFFLPFPNLMAGITLHYTTLLYLGAVISLLYTTLHYWGHYS